MLKYNVILNVSKKNKTATFCVWLFILCLMLFVNQKAYCQFDEGATYTPPSPNAASMLKFANTPVNLYTGIPSISADLHVLNARSYNFPISLLYHGAGNKVQDIAGNVGLGWSITTNCMITRVVRGLPDEGANGYFGGGVGNSISHALDVTTMNGIASNTLDGEPDLFYYVVNGQTGKFVFNKNGNPVLLSDNGMRILNTPFKQELGVNGWILEDLTGNTFFFGTDTSSIESTTSVLYLQSSTSSQQFNSTWYLNKITASNNTENLIFNYIAGSPIKTTYYSQRESLRDKITSTFNKGISFLGITFSEPSTTSEFTTEAQQWYNNIEQNVSSPKYLSSITSSNESAYFTYDSQNTRKDLPNGKILVNIDIKDYKGELIKSFGLVQDYFYSFYNDSKNVGSYISIDNYRLKLSNVTMTSGINTANKISLFSFEYHQDINLPPRKSNKFDHWGYFNDSYNDSDNQAWQFDLNSSPPDRSPNYATMGANILKRIYYQTGGYKEFTFEANTYTNPSQTTNNYAGGLRIAKIVSAGDQTTTPVISSYNYNDDAGLSTGKLIVPSPIYTSYIEHDESEVPYTYIPWTPPIAQNGPYSPPINSVNPSSDMVPAPAGFGGANYGSLIMALINLLGSGNTVTHTSYTAFVLNSSISMKDMFDIDGTIVGYSKVTVNNSNEGKTVNTFTDRDDYPDYTNQLRVDANFNTLGRISPNLSPFTPATSYSFARGHLKQSLVYDQAGNLLSKITNQYMYSNIADSVKGMRCAISKIHMVNGAYSSIANDYHNIGSYYYIPRQLLLQKSLRESYIPGNSTPISDTTTFTYNSTYPSIITSKKTRNSDNSVTLTTYTYVIDKSNIAYSKQSETDAVTKLYTDGKFGLLLDQVTKLNNNVLNGNRVGYKNWTINGSTLTLPETVYQNSGQNIIPKFQYLSYDQYGSAVSIKSTNNVIATGLMGYSKLYKIAQVTNGNINDVFYENFEEGTGNLNGDAKTGVSCYTGAYSKTITGLDNGNYQLSYWLKSGSTWSLQTINNIAVTASQYVISISGQIDDIRFNPVNALVTTYTFDPLYGITSSTDATGNTTFYEYDPLQRLMNVKDQHGNIIKNFAYNTVIQQPNSVGTVVYQSAATTGGYTTNQCSSDSTPNPLVINYTVPAGRYTSVISQADADQQATNDLIGNGQGYANQVGGCKLNH